MRVLVLCYEYPPIGGGGGRVAKSVAEALVARGHEVRVQTAALGRRSQQETVGGVEITRTASLRRAPDTCRVHEMGLYVATSFLPTLRHLREWRPDVMHAHFAMPTGALAWAAYRVARTPYVLTAHLGDVPGGVPQQTDNLFRLVAPLARVVWRDAAACTAVSSFVQELARRAYAVPVERVVNGTLLDGRSSPPQPPSAVPHIVFAGRFNPQKRPQALLDALAGLSECPWQLTMIGDGPLMDAVRQRLEQHPLLHERVRLTGWLEANEVQRVLANADLLCMPSSSEGMPVAAIEALAHGLAIVASDLPGFDDVLQDGVNGLRVKKSGSADLRQKLGFLMQHPQTLTSMKHASWEKAREFDIHAIAGQYERVLESAAARK